ncbi:hypothetical protein BWO91_01100 [Plantibacter flavus]|nr:hypothetical protein BWO91_01100 [Plantibacter flavus]
MLQTENPSWLSPVTKGATTIWERWDSLLEDGSVNPGEMTSFNHYALGAVADWLHRTVAGLAPAAPGYRELRIAPRPIDGLDHAKPDMSRPTARRRWRGDAMGPHSACRRSCRRTRRRRSRCRVPRGDGRVRSSRLDGRGHGRRLDSRRHHARPRLAALRDHRPTGLVRRLLRSVGAHDQAKADDIRRGTQWSRGRTVRQLLMFTPPSIARRRGRGAGCSHSGTRSCAITPTRPFHVQHSHRLHQ